jgi:hypothetical protein
MIATSVRSRSGFVSVAIVACLLIADVRLAVGETAADKPGKQLSAQEWREDLHFLAAQMRLKRKSLFHTMTEAEFVVWAGSQRVAGERRI